MKKIVVLMTLVLSGHALADLDGAEILRQEAERAQELQRLQHQAELLKQQAEIAKYANTIRENGGNLADYGLDGTVAPKAQASKKVAGPSGGQSSSGGANKKKADLIPSLVQIEKDRAAFDTENGRVFGRIGQTLPGGYRIVSLDMREGVRLQKNGMVYDIDMAW